VRTFVRVALGLVALAVVGLLVLVLALPAIVDGAELRTRLDQAARDTLGRSLEYGELEIGILPPRVEVSELVLGGATPGSPPALRSSRAALTLAWRPLLSGEAVVDALVIDGAELRMLRTSQGIDLLVAALPAAPLASAEPAAVGSPISLRRVSLRDSRIVFEDRVAAPPVVWQLDEVRLDATGGATAARVDFELTAQLASGGELRAAGRIELAGASEASVELEGFSFAPLASYLEALDRAGGAGSVAIDVVRGADGAIELDLEASSDALEAASGDTTAVGAVDVTAQLRLEDGVLEGPYSVDLTGATLDVAGGVVHKAAGEPGRLKGRVRIDDTGTTSDFHLQLRNLGADAKLRSAPSLRVELAVPAFALDGWEAAVPALADYAPRGELVVDRLVYTEGPPRLVGSAELRRVVVAQGDGAPPLEVAGFVDATGTELKLRQMFATAASARFQVDGGVSDLFGARELTVQLRTPEPVESNRVFSLVDSLRDAIFGALALELDLGLPLSGPAASRPALERLAGEFSFQIGGDEAGGRLRGVSLLRQVFDRFGSLGHAALLALPAKRGKSLDEYYSEEFRVAAGSFRIENGEARTDDLHIVHEKYRANLRGGLRLSDLTLDMRGEIVIGSELDAALSGASTGRERTISLARVGGTLADPTIALRDEDVSRFVAQYALRSDGKLSRKIDKALGKGASALLRDVLGGGRR
jgi:hypothetical protein